VKAIKMVGLAALMALMAMAFLGAASAIASEPISLCAKDTSSASVCETKVTSVHETSVGNAKLLSSVGTTECEVLFSGEVTEEGSPLVISGKFTYTNCKLGGSSCSATEESGPAEIQVLGNGHETAEVTGEGLVHLVCPGFIDCSYNGTGLKGTAKGPLLSTQKNGEVALSEQSTTKETGGFLCPKTAKLDITTTPLTEVFLQRWVPTCIEAEHVKGLWKDSKCTEMDNLNASKYELGWALPGTKVTAGAHVCVRVLGGRGHYKKEKNGVCEELEKLGGQKWELGTATGSA